jgi:hypothetical protein
VVAVGNWLAARRWPSLLGMPTMSVILNLMTITAVDATAIARASSRDQTVFLIVMHNGLNMVFMSLAQFAVPRRRELLLLALLLSVIESGFLIWGGLSSTIPLLMLDFSFGLIAGQQAITRMGTLILRAEERVVELEAAAAELRHQVAERARSLGEAFAKMDTVGVPPLAEGDRFDARYRVVRPLGAGGMGAVYEVERVTDARRLALKVIPGIVSGVAAARFAREAEIAEIGARVRHRNLVSIVDIGISRGGTPFLAMELARGGSLEERRGDFGDVAWGLLLLRQIVDGLAALHRAGVLHRDIKPTNILLACEAGGACIAKICDFGIARIGTTDDGADVTADALRSPPLTRTGEIVGTPLYVAPEIVCDEQPFRPSADVFSLAVLAYEVLSGRHPFGIPPALFSRRGQHLPIPLPIESVDAATSETLVAGLARDPAKRPALQTIERALASAQPAATRSTAFVP